MHRHNSSSQGAISLRDTDRKFFKSKESLNFLDERGFELTIWLEVDSRGLALRLCLPRKLTQFLFTLYLHGVAL